MDFRQLEVFAAVVEEGGFSRAAEKLYLSQPTVSAHIGALEEELGQLLIERGVKSARPTESGSRFYDYARRILALREEALAGMNNADGSSITIAASSVPAKYILPGLIAGYHQQVPQISFHILQTDSAGVYRKLSAEEAELGFAGSPGDNRDCVHQAVASDRLVLILPDSPEFRLALAGDGGLEALLAMPMISRKTGSGTRAEFERYLRRYHPGIKPRIVAEMDDAESIKQSVAAGLGVAVISERAADDYSRFGQILICSLENTASRSLYLARRRNHTLSPAAADFSAYLEQELKL